MTESKTFLDRVDVKVFNGQSGGVTSLIVFCWTNFVLTVVNYRFASFGQDCLELEPEEDRGSGRVFNNLRSGGTTGCGRSGVKGY